MFSSRAPPYAPPVSRSSASSPSLSDIRSTPRPTRTVSIPLRQLSVPDLNELDQQRPEPFRIPRPTVAAPRDIHLYQPGFGTPVPIRTPPPPPPIQYQIRPFYYQRVKDKRYVQEKPTGLCATCCSGGCGAFAASVYLLIVLALPAIKLVLGVLYRDECPLNKNIPLYMMVAGSAGIAVVLFLLLSSSCTYCRASIKARKITHGLMISTIGFARAMQILLAIFLFVWFFFGNVWVFGVRSLLQTQRNSDGNNGNYCHPVLYWPAFYILIFTYVIAVFVFIAKFCARLLCCGVCDLWKGAFS